MSNKLPCNLLLGIQNVSLQVSEQEESCVRNAALLVNRLVKFYEKETNSTDPNKVMALVALDLAMCGIKFDSEHKELHHNVHSENSQLIELVSEFTL
jgi:hypothetical protein